MVNYLSGDKPERAEKERLVINCKLNIDFFSLKKRKILDNLKTGDL